jgi:hypothetical protein
VGVNGLRISFSFGSKDNNMYLTVLMWELKQKCLFSKTGQNCLGVGTSGRGSHKERV